MNGNRHGRSVAKTTEKIEVSIPSDFLMDRRVYGKTVESALKKWTNNALMGKKMTEMAEIAPQRAGRTVIATEKQERYLKMKTRENISANFMTTPENVIRMVTLGVSQSNRGEIFTDYTLNNYDDSFWVMQAVRQNAQRGGLAGESIYSTSRPRWVGETEETVVRAAAAAASNAYAGTVPGPLRKYKVAMIVDGIQQGADDGQGNIVSALLDSGAANTMNYESGEYVLNSVAAALDGKHVTFETMFDSEREENYDKYAKMSYDIQKKNFRAMPIPLGYEYTRFAQEIVRRGGAGELGEMLVNAIGDEHAKDSDYRAIRLANRVSRTNDTVYFNTDMTSSGAISRREHAQNQTSAIGLAKAQLLNDIERGGINKMICAPDVLEYVGLHDKFEADDSQPEVGGTWYAGKLKGKIDVYGTIAKPTEGLLGYNEALLIFHNPQQDGEHSIAFGNVTEFSDEVPNAQHKIEGTITTVEDAIRVQDKYIRKMVYTNLM